MTPDLVTLDVGAFNCSSWSFCDSAFEGTCDGCTLGEGRTAGGRESKEPGA
jgi:hypothetical protein